MTFTLAAGMMYIGSSISYAELGDQVLKTGMKNQDVQTLQEHLTDLGYFKYEGLTTYYGEYTEEAVREFQCSMELEPNGMFDKITYEVMKKTINPSEEVDEEEDIDPIEDENESEDPDKYKLIVNSSLKLGSSGPDVKALQEVLKALGYLKIENTTDYFGTQTEEAINIFQENSGLEVDGSAGPKTIDVLNRQIIRKGLKIAMPNRSSLSRGSLGEQIVSTGKNYIGVRYRYGGSSANGFDCTGYTQFVYKQHNISVPRSTSEQAKVGTALSKSELQIGDLVIFKNTYRSGPSHAGIYIGDGQFIHSSTSRGVRIDHMDDNYWGGRFHSARRVF